MAAAGTPIHQRRSIPRPTASHNMAASNPPHPRFSRRSRPSGAPCRPRHRHPLPAWLTSPRSPTGSARPPQRPPRRPSASRRRVAPGQPPTRTRPMASQHSPSRRNRHESNRQVPGHLRGSPRRARSRLSIRREPFSGHPRRAVCPRSHCWMPVRCRRGWRGQTGANPYRKVGNRPLAAGCALSHSLMTRRCPRGCVSTADPPRRHNRRQGHRRAGSSLRRRLRRAYRQWRRRPVRR